MKKRIDRWLNICWTLLMTVLLVTPAVGNAATNSLPKEVLVNGVEFILVPEGWFYKTGGISKAGSAKNFMEETGGGNVKVWLDSYYIAKFEARARDLVRYLNSQPGKLERYAGANISCSVREGKEGQFFQFRPDEDLPATHMSWELSNRWASWMGMRLLSEMEWEKAARGEDQRIYPWGDEYPDETLAGFNTRSPCFTWPVNSFEKGLSPYGVYNMAGNVREFVSDWYSRQFDESLKDGVRAPLSTSQGSKATKDDGTFNEYAGPWKILKGGRWQSRPHQLLIGYRDYYPPNDPFRCNGTRFALDVAAVRAHLAKGTATVLAP